MSDLSTLKSDLQNRLGTRSMGVKLIVVSVLAVLMTIPALFVFQLVEERTRRSEDVAREISGFMGGRQTFLGPTLVIPYTAPSSSPILAATEKTEKGVYMVFPAQAVALVKTHTEERRRSLFKVPVFQSDLQFDADFDLSGVPSSAPSGAVLDWSHAEIVIGVSDARGAQADGTLTVNGKTETFVPAGNIEGVASEASQEHSLAVFGIKAAGFAQQLARFHATANLRFTGAQRIAVLAYGKTTHLTVTGDWPNPSFDGGFLPVSRTVTSHGFSADWSVPFIARGVRAEGTDLVKDLNTTALGVSFIEVADPYQSVNRSLKYVLLFLGLLFLSYFVFEITTGKRVHPAQYVLVGIAQIIFYLLLLSFAERIGFDLGFLVAGGATVCLLAANAAWIFESRAHGIRAFICFGLLYALIYLLLRLEDNALMVGAIASFLAVAAAMYFTRKIDWYSSIPSPGSAKDQFTSVLPKNKE